MESIPNPIESPPIQSPSTSPKFHFLIYSLEGKKSYGTLIRSASAFKCESVFVLGLDKKILKTIFGSQGTIQKMKFQFFNTIDELILYCKENNIFICGVDIKFKEKEKVDPIQNFIFPGNTLFILGDGLKHLSKEMEDICDCYTYVDQVKDNLGLINISVIGSIVFHYFGIWAEYEESGLNEDYGEEKYKVKTKKEFQMKDKKEE